MRAVRFSLLPLLLILFAACSGDSPSAPATPSINGTWNGTGAGVTVNMVLTSAGTGTVSGNGTIGAGSSSIPITITGTHAHPGVALTGKATGFQDMIFQGSFTDNNTIMGTLNGSGFSNFALTLKRQ